MGSYKTILFISLFLLCASAGSAQTDTSRKSTSDSSRSEYDALSDQNSIGFNLDVGASLIRNTVAPTFNLNIHLFIDNTYKFQLGTSTNFFFERDSARNFDMYPNTFVKLEWYWKDKTRKDSHKFDVSSWSGIGAAYLLAGKGDYYEGPTLKFYHLIGLEKSAVISLELYMTNDFKTFFPGITITFL